MQVVERWEGRVPSGQPWFRRSHWMAVLLLMAVDDDLALIVASSSLRHLQYESLWNHLDS